MGVPPGMLTYLFDKTAITCTFKFVKSALGNIFPSIEHGSTYISQKVDNFLLCLFDHEVNNSQYLMFGSVQNGCALSFCVLRGLVTNVTVHRNGCGGGLVKGNGGGRCNTAGYLLCEITTTENKDKASLNRSIIVSQKGEFETATVYKIILTVRIKNFPGLFSFSP